MDSERFIKCAHFLAWRQQWEGVVMLIFDSGGLRKKSHSFYGDISALTLHTHIA